MRRAGAYSSDKNPHWFEGSERRVWIPVDRGLYVYPRHSASNSLCYRRIHGSIATLGNGEPAFQSTDAYNVTDLISIWHTETRVVRNIATGIRLPET